MIVNIPEAVHNLIEEYRRFLKTSYRFLDDHLRKQFEDHLARTDFIVKGPYVTLARDFALGHSLQELANAGRIAPEVLKARWPFGDGRLFSHQEQALEVGKAGRSLVVTTGTGSGKTEAFLLPIIDGIISRKRNGLTGVQAIFLYPMNALANDQLERMRKLLRGTGLDISYGLYTGDSDAAAQSLREAPAESERTTRAAIRQRPPDIILTNYKQLEFLLVRRKDRALFTPSLRYLVLDEVHSYRGALATEIACLIRRLKAHAGLAPGELTVIGTSATVASGEDGAKALASFSSTLFGEKVRMEDIIKESYVVQKDLAAEWMPTAPYFAKDELYAINVNDNSAVVSLAERLTGKSCPAEGPISNRISAVLAGNLIIKAIEEIFAAPTSLDEAAREIQNRYEERKNLSLEQVRREIEAYLLVGSVGDDDHPPRLQPKLHTFFHGIYDVSLCTNPECRTLVPQGGTVCGRCGSVARPAALCRTCGQDFIKVRFERPDDNMPVGTGDFFSDENTAFLTHEIRELPDRPEAETEEEPAETGEMTGQTPRQHRGNRRVEAEARLERVGLCPGCGRLLGEGQLCPACNRQTILMFMHRGKLNTCPACGDIYPRGDIVTPLRTGTASTVSVLATHHLDRLKGEDRKLLVFADNRQDAAHQAGYTADKHRTFALRHIIAKEVRNERNRGVYLDELPERLFDAYQEMGIIQKRPTQLERENWLFALRYSAANEFTRYSRQRASLETLGIVAVEYEFLDELMQDDRFLRAAQFVGADAETALNLTRAVLDIMRRNRSIAYDFFLEYIDPAKKRKYREVEAEPYDIRIPERDRHPKAFALERPEHIRRAQRLIGFVQENPKAGQLTAPQKIVARVAGSREASELFLRTVIPLLEELGILTYVPQFPIPAKERTSGLHPLQIAPRVIRLHAPEHGFRCNACQTWRAYYLPTCPTPKCTTGRLIPAQYDEENYYARSYLQRTPQRLAVVEHSAQISGEDRAKRETDFKEGKLDVLVCTPTLELGVDIGPLLTIVLRNTPPTPANYIQRVGRSGRRLRIGFASTFCAGGAHDRHAFERPEWFVAGRFDPPRLRLDNPKIVWRHLRSYVLEKLETELPNRMGELLDDLRNPTKWKSELLEDFFEEIGRCRDRLVTETAALLEQDRLGGRTMRYGEADAAAIVDGLRDDLTFVFETWWQRVKQLDKEFKEFSTIGSPRQDDKKAAARKRAYFEITQDPERAYTLNYLSTKGILPAYQFPVDTFSLDPGVNDTPTLFRTSAIAIEEFAPGNYVYANGHKLKSIRVLFPGGPGASAPSPGRTDAEASGRLRAFHFCDQCDEAVESGRNRCPRCHEPLPAATDIVFVDSFEAEENLKISSDEESRQKETQERRETLLAESAEKSLLYLYQLTPVEHLKLAEVLITNWGRLESKTGSGSRFWLCPDCGRHLPHDRLDPKKKKAVEEWLFYHKRFCSGEPIPLILAYKFSTDALILNIPSRGDTQKIGRSSLSPMLVTLAEALLAGAQNLLELEAGEISSFVRKSLPGSISEQIVYYETVPGGAGYLEEIAAKLPEIAQAAMQRLFGHSCRKACYLCLKRYGNQRWHPFFDKDGIRDLLVILSEQEHVQAQEDRIGAGLDKISEMLQKRLAGTDDSVRRYPKGEIEEPLRRALKEIEGLPPGEREFEIKDEEGRLVTVPDFAWPDARIAVFCDGFAVHGNRETLESDAQKRNYLQSRGWVVLTYWGRTILKNADACAKQILEIYEQRTRIQ
ncbi:MAG: DEAD/DEAH box helicase [Clostridiales bacterium]|nr:DEAD/DEAH box helicase [Clostridiales bacterium]